MQVADFDPLTDRCRLTYEGKKNADEIAAVLKESPQTCIKILGFTGKTAKQKQAVALSLARARAVRDALSAAGCSNTMAARGVGFADDLGNRCELSVCSGAEAADIEGAVQAANRSPDADLRDLGDDRFHVSSVHDPASAFEAVLAADREVTEDLRREVEHLRELLRAEQDNGLSLEREVRGLYEEKQRLVMEAKQLSAAHHQGMARLAAIREEHRSIDVDEASLHTDRSQAAEELAFLQQKVDDDLNTVVFFSKANDRLERHNKELALQMATLEMERKNLSREAQLDLQAAKREERQLAELRNRADQLRRSKVALHQQSHQARSREDYLREVRRGTAASSPSLQAQKPQAQPAGSHSWASHVSTPLRSGMGASFPPRLGSQAGRPANLPVPPGHNVHV